MPSKFEVDLYPKTFRYVDNKHPERSFSLRYRPKHRRFVVPERKGTRVPISRRDYTRLYAERIREIEASSELPYVKESIFKERQAALNNLVPPSPSYLRDLITRNKSPTILRRFQAMSPEKRKDIMQIITIFSMMGIVKSSSEDATTGLGRDKLVGELLEEFLPEQRMKRRDQLGKYQEAMERNVRERHGSGQINDYRVFLRDSEGRIIRFNENYDKHNLLPHLQKFYDKKQSNRFLTAKSLQSAAKTYFKKRNMSTNLSGIAAAKAMKVLYNAYKKDLLRSVESTSKYQEQYDREAKKSQLVNAKRFGKILESKSFQKAYNYEVKRVEKRKQENKKLKENGRLTKPVLTNRLEKARKMYLSFADAKMPTNKEINAINYLEKRVRDDFRSEIISQDPLRLANLHRRIMSYQTENIRHLTKNWKVYSALKRLSLDAKVRSTKSLDRALRDPNFISSNELNRRHLKLKRQRARRASR